jgi:predicted dienelactone hydrolase
VSARSAQTLLVFSHGYQGINIQSFELMEALASHGFIVISPEHTGNAQASPTDTFDEAASNRAPDVSYLIDRMFARR